MMVMARLDVEVDEVEVRVREGDTSSRTTAQGFQATQVTRNKVSGIDMP